jgi:molybdate transport system ATP-binding protein
MTDDSADRLQAHVKGRLGAFELDAELAVPAQGVTALVGPSGCGKTTVLRCLAGLCRLPGRVAFRGEVWQDAGTFVPPHRRPVGYVFQEASLFPHLTVRGNLAFALKRAARAGEATAHGFDELVALLALEPLLNRATQELSGGERQRVAIARALATQPRLLLMDEPVSSLDPDGKAEVLGRLEPAMAVLRIPVIYVSHDAAEVTRLADRVLSMAGGRIAPAHPGPAADMAEAVIAAMSPAEVRGLALAALKAGLRPA